MKRRCFPGTGRPYNKDEPVVKTGSAFERIEYLISQGYHNNEILKEAYCTGRCL